ncbi:MAG: soluble lytic murein transglycosylase-like protein [Clostridia bacterium]|jgi:soluble lytic murein transglycosylase-like protein|uniref:lytic transglycosylase domain-containing protein n=1 Tax=Petroclostridium xylanilyticum TaxID=1792311 RepID=UPI000E3DD283|nr:lytic transglycosylase domain-containing protein [Petroclostridium xylanilyticum]MBZ4645120.1 soluble lytic murein transglycosylase-like protein [Clostridia bacterium]
MMNIRVSDIFKEKLDSIQARTPLKIPVKESPVPFQEMLDTAMGKNDTALDNQPADKSQLMSSIEKAVYEAGQKYNIHPNVIKAVIAAESGFDANALSPKGAQGLMQLMPGTAKVLGIKNPWNVSENIHGGTKYLREKLDQFNGDIKLALAAYNAGPNSVIKYGGIPPYTETQNYVRNVLKYIDQYNTGQKR